MAEIQESVNDKRGFKFSQIFLNSISFLFCYSFQKMTTNSYILRIV